MLVRAAAAARPGPRGPVDRGAAARTSLCARFVRAPALRVDRLPRLRPGHRHALCACCARPHSPRARYAPTPGVGRSAALRADVLGPASATSSAAPANEKPASLTLPLPSAKNRIKEILGSEGTASMSAALVSPCRIKQKRRLRWRRASTLRFPGQRFDSASGLNYNMRRDYEAGTGRYTQSDPIGLHGGISTYGYAAQQPLMAIDPSGLKVIWSGTVAAFAGIEGVGAGFFMFDLKSDCVGGKQVEAKVLASAVAAGVGAKWTGGGSSVQLHDWTDQANADTLEGGFAALSAGIVVGGGGGWSKYRLGNAWSDGFGFMPQGPAFGFDFSAGVYIGASYVLSSSSKDCSGCER